MGLTLPDGTLALVVDAGASADIGAGHAMRCAALAEYWVRAGYGDAVFCGAISLGWVAERVAAVGARMASVAADTRGVLVVDDYDPVVRAGQAAKGQYVLKALVDDGFGSGSVDRGYDVVWNPNAHAAARDYLGFEGTVLAGPDFLAARIDLPKWQPVGRRWIGVMLGGATPPLALRDAILALADQLPGWTFAGAGSWVPRGWATLDPIDPWARASHCDVLISGAGTTLWEVGVVGAPAVIVQMAANQSRNAAWARREGGRVVDATRVPDAAALSNAIAAAVPGARPLPRLHSGIVRVAKRLRALALESN